MEARSSHEEKYPLNKSSLKFLQKIVTEPSELVLKSDLLINAIYERDEIFVKEILSSPGDRDYINFQLLSGMVYDPKQKINIQKNFRSDYPLSLPRTPLTLAVYFGLINTVELLLTHGADVNLSGQPQHLHVGYQYTPLEYAVHHRKTSVLKDNVSIEVFKEIVDILKEHGAIIQPSVEKLDTDGLISNQLRYTNFFYMKNSEEKHSRKVQAKNKSQIKLI